MLTVRVLPRRGIPLRAACASLEVTGVLTLGHVWAGGVLPSLPWLAAMAAVVFGAGLLVLRGRIRPLVAVPALVAVQLLLHAWLSALTMGGAHHEHLGSAHGAALAPAMLAVHVAGGLFTALAWELRARVVDVVVTWTRLTSPPYLLARRAPAPVFGPTAWSRRFVVSAAPRRGPPARPLLTPA
ncbi:hypothetical protein [Nocardioides sp. GXZ039]|uniref:hypothetical protein n=1 Tax=Nocardioides sp. GXZ039 TaxID=3136018 RepID=UPI0030F440C0